MLEPHCVLPRGPTMYSMLTLERMLHPSGIGTCSVRLGTANHHAVDMNTHQETRRVSGKNTILLRSALFVHRYVQHARTTCGEMALPLAGFLQWFHKKDNNDRLETMGFLACGLVHDITNAIHYTSLTLETAQYRKSKKAALRDTLRGLRYIAQLTDAVKKQMNNQCVRQHFSPVKEINLLCLLLKYRFQHVRISVVKDFERHIRLYGNVAQFHQCVMNILLNAADAYEQQCFDKREKNCITLMLTKNERSCVLSIRDNAGGMGSHMSQRTIHQNQPKKHPNKHMGIGLLIAKKCVEEVFLGSLSIQSINDMGTTFTLQFPFTKKQDFLVKNNTVLYADSTWKTRLKHLNRWSNRHHNTSPHLLRQSQSKKRPFLSGSPQSDRSKNAIGSTTQPLASSFFC